MKVKQNNHLIDYKWGNYHVDLVLPSYQSLNKSNLGYHWNLGVSLSIGGTNDFSINIGIIFGWLRITKYD